MNKIYDFLKENKLLCDGAFGTYFADLTQKDSLPELANESDSTLVKQIHKSYLEAGARLIRTNSFAANKESLGCDDDALIKQLQAAYRNANEAVCEHKERKPGTYFIAADIGPIPSGKGGDEEETKKQYRLICETFLKEGAEILLFETFHSIEPLLAVLHEIKQKQDVFVVVQFCVNQYGYSNAGISAAGLLREAEESGCVDALGFNCGVGPGHLQKILEGIPIPEGIYLTALPNAGYPSLMQNRMIFRDNSTYFARKMAEMASFGVDIIGGCCGTTPEYIKKTGECVSLVQTKEVREKKDNPYHKNQTVQKENGFFCHKKPGEKLLAVELSPPPGANDEKVMEAAYMLKNLHVDVVTFPDSPSGRTRADSILMSRKVMQETGVCVMPHICCRDKNAIAMRSQILGAYINGIRNMLVVTGDPVPTLIRQDVKSVFNFDAVGLMKIISELNREEFCEDPMFFGGAINQTRPNLSVEIKRVEKKMAQGASFFLTQPVFSNEDAMRLKQIKEATGARILCGIMPLVSLKNASFIRNEMAGIQVGDDIINRFRPNMTRQEGEEVGIAIAREVIELTSDFCDGYYFSIPFNRVYLLNKVFAKVL